MSTLNEIESVEYTETDIKDALRRPDNFGYFGGDERMFKTRSLGPVVQNRDSGVLERSNARVLKRELQKAVAEGVIEQDSFEFDEANHWAVGWVEHLNFDVIDAEGKPTRVARWLKLWFDSLADYPIADESDHSELEREETRANIDSTIDDVLRHIWAGEPAKGEAWADEVFTWLWNNDQSAVECTGDHTASPDEDQVRSALVALGHLRLFSFTDDDATFVAVRIEERDGWLVPTVTPEVRDEVADRAAEHDEGDSLPCAPRIRALPVDADGNVTIDLGLTFALVE